MACEFQQFGWQRKGTKIHMFASILHPVILAVKAV
jgi:hypothetical protein